jgi:hypothetical protein
VIRKAFRMRVHEGAAEEDAPGIGAREALVAGQPPRPPR